MQDQKISSSQRLAEATKNLESALSRLKNLIIEQNNALKEEKKLRTGVIEDLDKHIENLATIIDNNG
jgi:hypothetical protein